MTLSGGGSDAGAGPLGLGVAFMLLTLPSHGCPALLPFQPWDQRWAGGAMLGFTPPTLLPFIFYFKQTNMKLLL